MSGVSERQLYLCPLFWPWPELDIDTRDLHIDAFKNHETEGDHKGGMGRNEDRGQGPGSLPANCLERKETGSLWNSEGR